jgi:uncharacterized protein (TIGR02145 family)
MKIVSLFFNLISIFVLIFSTNGIAQKTITIGNQVWMAENLNVFYFRNGDPIPIIKNNEEWNIAIGKQQPACCYYANNAINGKKYGVLYNWYAVVDPRGLAPKGWHIPTDEEWGTLIDALGGEFFASEKMKSTEGWGVYFTMLDCVNCKNWSQEQKAGQICNKCLDKRIVSGSKSGNGNNQSGFCGLPGGGRDPEGEFIDIGNFGYWWSSTKDDSLNAFYRSLNNDHYVGRAGFSNRWGLSVRCIKD